MAYKIQLKQASNGNRYMTTSLGVLEFDNPSVLYRPAGIPRGLDVQLALTAGTLLNMNDNVGYRVLWGIRDLNNNVPLGAPSSRTTIRSGAANQDVNVTFLIPNYITTSHFYQIYRTAIVNGAAADPGDEMFLVYEGNPTAADIVAGTITIKDSRPDSILGPALYTNATQENGGIIRANYQPPMARDLEEYRNLMCYSNTTSKQILFLTLVGMAGFTAGTSTVTIGGIVYNCAAYAGAYSTSPAGENTATGTFVYYTAGTVSEQIRGTAESLCRVINRYGANTQYYAFYISEVGDTPGQMEFEERGIGGTAFSAIAHSTIINNFEPKLQTSGTFVSSTADRKPNRIFVSKKDQPGAVPYINYIDIGPANEPIHRILKLRDTLIVIKDKSVWQVSGTEFENFQWAPLDLTIQTRDRFNSAAFLNNQIYLLCNKGLAAISSAGADIVSGPEEFNLRFPTADSDGFSVGVGHEYLETYFLSTYDPEFKQEGYAYPYSVYAYQENTEIPTFSRWLLNANCMAVYKDRLFYGLNNNYGHVLEQRLYAYDFYDEAATATVSAINSSDKTATIAFTPSVNYDTYPSQFGYGYLDGFDKGFVVVDGGNRYLVTSWDNATNKATFNTVTGLTNGAKICYRPIPFHLEYLPIDADNPCVIKRFGKVFLKGEIDDSNQIDFYFYNERDRKKFFFYYKYLASPYSMPKPLHDLQTAWAQQGCTPYKSVVGVVPTERSLGSHLSVKLTNNVAGSRLFIKALGVAVTPTADEIMDSLT